MQLIPYPACQLSLSVMSSESGIGGQELIGEDVFEALRLPATSAIRAKLQPQQRGGSTASLLQRLVSEVKHLAAASTGTVDSQSQTDPVDQDGTPATIDGKLRRVDYQLSEAAPPESQTLNPNSDPARRRSSRSG